MFNTEENENQISQELSLENKKSENREKFLKALSIISPKKLQESKISVDSVQEELEFINNPILWAIAIKGLPVVVDWYWHAAPYLERQIYPINIRELFLGYMKDSIINQEEKLIKEQGQQNIPKNLKSVMLNFLINLADGMVQNKVQSVQQNSETGWSTRFFINPSDEKKSNFLNMMRSRLTDFLVSENGNWKFLDNCIRDPLSSIMSVELTRFRNGKKTTINDFADNLFNDPKGPVTGYLDSAYNVGQKF